MVGHRIYACFIEEIGRGRDPNVRIWDVRV